MSRREQELCATRHLGLPGRMTHRSKRGFHEEPGRADQVAAALDRSAQID